MRLARFCCVGASGVGVTSNLCGIALTSAWNFCVNARVTWAMPIGLRGFWLARRLVREGRLAAGSVRERDYWT